MVIVVILVTLYLQLCTQLENHDMGKLGPNTFDQFIPTLEKIIATIHNATINAVLHLVPINPLIVSSTSSGFLSPAERQHNPHPLLSTSLSSVGATYVLSILISVFDMLNQLVK
jgi:hypothetical protein